MESNQKIFQVAQQGASHAFVEIYKTQTNFKKTLCFVLMVKNLKYFPSRILIKICQNVLQSF